mgnify:CR=1 FL=1
MQRRLLAILLFFVFFTLSSSAFYNFTWGTTKELIKQKEVQQPFFETDKLLVYDAFLFEQKVQKIYSFEDNKLKTVLYTFTEVPCELKAYLTGYEFIDEEIAKLLQEPLSKTERWGNDRFKNLPELAMALGDVTYSSIWIANSLITHALYSKDLNITHIIYINSFESILKDYGLNEEVHPDYEDI